MGEGLGIAVFALGILVSVCLHEAGHMGTAKLFGMKVTRYFVGFGPTLFSFRRGETEYGVKAIPLGGFVKIVGMTPLDDDVEPGDEQRAMWRYPVWKRSIVLAAGSITHFLLAFLTLWVVLVFLGVQDPRPEAIEAAPAKVSAVVPCVSVTWEIDPATKEPRQCKTPTDPVSPAAEAGLQPGDVITAVNGTPTPTYGQMRTAVRALRDETATIKYQRGGIEYTAKPVHVYAVTREKDSAREKPAAQITPDDLETSGMLGISAEIPVVRFGPVAAVGQTVDTLKGMVGLTFQSLTKIPSKIPKLWAAITGAPRDPETPVSVVGASRIGGELVSISAWTQVLTLFAVLNLFFGIFNLLPLLPMDGGHIAIIWFERARSWWASRRGRPDPGRVDYAKLTPITLAVVSILGVFVLLTVTADIINPISILSR